MYNPGAMRIMFVTGALALIQQTSCDNRQQKIELPVSKPRPPIHRFVLTRFPNDSGVAFDTQTGQICRTWDWSPSGKAADPDPNGGGIPQRRIGEFAPTCLSVYQQHPGGPGDGVQVVEDQPTSDK